MFSHEYIAPDELVPWEANPRVNDHVVGPLAATILRLGWGAPALVQMASWRVIGGHTRVKAALLLQQPTPELLDIAKTLGIKPSRPHGLLLKSVTGYAGRIPVRLMDVSDAQAAALAVADNAHGEKAQWDNDGLAAILAELQADEGPNDLLRATGLSDDRIADLLAKADAQDAELAEELAGGEEAPPEAEGQGLKGEHRPVGDSDVVTGEWPGILYDYPEESFGAAWLHWDAALAAQCTLTKALRLLATRMLPGCPVAIQDCGASIGDVRLAVAEAGLEYVGQTVASLASSPPRIQVSQDTVLMLDVQHVHLVRKPGELGEKPPRDAPQYARDGLALSDLAVSNSPGYFTTWNEVYGYPQGPIAVYCARMSDVPAAVASIDV